MLEGYTLAYAEYTVGVDVGLNAPVVGEDGGVVTGWTVSPPLPAGLHFYGLTPEDRALTRELSVALDPGIEVASLLDTLAGGTITGTPTEVSSAGEYVVTASNSGGEDRFTLVLAVNDG